LTQDERTFLHNKTTKMSSNLNAKLRPDLFVNNYTVVTVIVPAVGKFEKAQTTINYKLDSLYRCP